MDPKTLDSFKEETQKIKAVLKEANTKKPLWLTETGSTSGKVSKAYRIHTPRHLCIWISWAFKMSLCSSCFRVKLMRVCNVG